jgi:8-oxo-dGTP pyrophosphatase MutT (NUDIX family)
MVQPAVVLPAYACAIIRDAGGRLLLQLRPLDARHAAGQLTCFGGAREDHETAEACLRRELVEELGWHPSVLHPACDLHQDGRFIARFFHCPYDGRGGFTTEPGHQALWVPPSAVPGLPLSPWHRAVLDAVARGDGRVGL